MKTLKVCLVLAALGMASLVFGAAKTVTVTTVDGAGGGASQGGSGSVCTSATDLGLGKAWNVQCNAAVYVRRACATSSTGCLLDAGYGDTIYDFRATATTQANVLASDGGLVSTSTANLRLHDPVKIQLRSSETRLCFRNAIQPPDGSTADAGDAFKCFLNEDAPF